jgi:ring-1,2-phenylacetyl-CoA epoxidase subunit PaaC
MASDSVYDAITDDDGDARWAYGTGFADPLEGLDVSVPPGVDAGDLAAFCLMLGDDALVMSHRLQEWCTNAPELEDEVALANIGLDLLGQARLLLARAGAVDGTGRSEDRLALFREAGEFRNVRLVELPNGDFACSIARLLVFSTWRLELLLALESSVDPVLAAVAAKGTKEVTYHRDYAAMWTVRLGDGTAGSRQRMQAGLDAVWPLVDELFDVHPIEAGLGSCGVAVDPTALRPSFDEVIGQVVAAATLRLPDGEERARVSGRTGRDGDHTEAMGEIVAELQCVARAHPEATW